MPGLTRLSEWALLLLLLAAVLWKGGKTLETTWILTGVAGFITFAWYWAQRQSGGAGGAGGAGKATWDIPRFLWKAAILFLLWTLLSYINSTAKNYGLDEVLRDTSLVLVFFWTARKMERHPKFFDQFILALSTATLIACAFGFAVYVFQPVSRFVGSFVDPQFDTDYWPNAWAEFLLLAWPIVLLWSRRMQPRRGALVWMALPGFVLGTLFLSYSRGAIIAFIGQLVLLAGFQLLSREGRAALRQSILIVALASCIALATFGAGNLLRGQFHRVQSVSEKVTFTASEGASSITERKEFWKEAIGLANARPLLGWGPYSFRFVHQHVEKGILATSDHPHSVLLKLATERGWPAAILFALVIGYVLIAHLFRRSVQALPWIAVVGVLAHNMIDYNLQFVGIILPFWMLLGILAAGLPGKPAPRRVRGTVEVLIAIVMLSVAVLEGRYLVTSSLGRHAEAREKTEEALLWYEESKGELFSRDLHLSRAHLYTSLGEYDEAQDALETYAALNGEDVRVWRLMGELALLQGNTRRAYALYTYAYRFGKWNDLALMRGLIDVLVRRGAIVELDSRRREEFDPLLNEYETAIERNLHFIALSQNVEEFLRIMEIFETQFPHDAKRYESLAGRVRIHSEKEREAVRSRPPGYLW
jgi:tetratricopeptide (TPR) repeat protein